MARTSKKDPRALIHEVFTEESAHTGLEEAVADFPVSRINAKPPNVPYSFWHILEHIRIAQRDLLEYVRNPKHTSPAWPEGDWPALDATTDAACFKRTIAAIKSVTRCAFLVLDYNAYHLGEFAILRQVMALRPKSRKSD